MKRYSKTAAQQCRFYEVDNIFEYMVETYINGNHSTLRRLYHELNKEARKDFIGFLLVECPHNTTRRFYKRLSDHIKERI